MTNHNSLIGYRILVVEDEVIVAWLLEETLFSLGCEVIGPATSVSKALAIIERGGVDAVSLDINLNGEKSYPVADALMERRVPFYFSTGYNRDSIPDTYRDIPMLQKPYDAAKLAAMLGNLVAPQVPVLSPPKGALLDETYIETSRLPLDFDLSYVPLIKKRAVKG